MTYKRWIRGVSIVIALIGLFASFQNCSPSSSKFEIAESSKSVDFIDNNGNGVNDTLEVPNTQTESGPNSSGPIFSKTSPYKVCNLSSNKEIYKFSDLLEFGGQVDLPGYRSLQYDIKESTNGESIMDSWRLVRKEESLRSYVSRHFQRAGLTHSDFVQMVPGEVYNESTGMFQWVSAENMDRLRTALTMSPAESGFPNLMPLPGYYFHYEIENGIEKKIPLQNELENFVGNLRFSHITSPISGLFGKVLIYTDFLDVPKSIAMRAKNQGELLNTNKTLEVPSHKVCYLPQFDGSILERNIGSEIKGDSVRIWNESDGSGSSQYGRRIERCFHDETKKCVSDNWLHRPNGFSDKLYNIEIQ